MGGNPSESRGGGRGHHHGGGGRGDGGFDQHQRGGSQDYNSMGRGMMGEGRFVVVERMLLLGWS